MQKFSSNIAGKLQIEERAHGIVSTPRRPADACVEDWATQIRDRVARGTIQVLDLARLIHAARTALQRGQWTHLCRSGQLPFSKRKAEMLEVIGESLGGLNAQTFAHLPAGWSTLYHLARLPRPLLDSYIADGTVHPGLTNAEAKALYAKFKGLCATGAKGGSIRRRVRRFQEFLRATSSEWTTAERRFVRLVLKQALTELDDTVESPAKPVTLGPPCILPLPETATVQHSATQQSA